MTYYLPVRGATTREKGEEWKDRCESFALDLYIQHKRSGVYMLLAEDTRTQRRAKDLGA